MNAGSESSSPVHKPDEESGDSVPNCDDKSNIEVETTSDSATARSSTSADRSQINPDPDRTENCVESNHLVDLDEVLSAHVPEIGRAHV